MKTEQIHFSQIKKITIIIIIFLSKISYAGDEEKYPYTMQGNLALPTSQQPNSLFSFNQNIVDKNDIQFFVLGDQLKGTNKNFTDISPGILYGISDKLSILGAVPLATKFKQNNTRSSGLEDCLIQCEYAFYNKQKLSYVNQATVLANITFPTGSIKKIPVTGFGSPAFSLGATINHLSIDWYAFAASTAIITTKSNNNIKFGNIFLYQCGFGKNIAYKTKKWLLTWILELDGIYNQRNNLNNKIDHNSGSNIIILAPSLWFSTQHLILQAGVGVPLLQNFSGKQNKDHHFTAVKIAYKL